MTDSPPTLIAAVNVGSRLPRVKTPLIAPRRRMFSSSNVFIVVIVVAGRGATIRHGPIVVSVVDPMFLAVPLALVEEFGVALVIEAANDQIISNLLKTALLEDALHTLIVSQRCAAHGLEIQVLEAVGDE